MSSSPNLDLATTAFLEGRYEEAIKHFDLALAEVGDHDKPVVHANRGAALMSLGEVEKAVKCFDEALALQPTHLESLHNKGVALSELERFDEAVQCFTKVTELAPDFFAGFAGLSEAFASLNRFPDAVTAASKAIALEADNPAGHTDKAFGLLKQKMYHDACASYAEAIKLGDDSAETARLYSIALSQEALDLDAEGKHAEALALLDKSLALVPSPAGFHNQGIVLLHARRVDDALQAFLKALVQNSNYFDSLVAVGALFTQKEDKLKDAVMYLERALAIDDKSIETRFNLGVAKIKLHDINAARAAWMRVLEIEPGEKNATQALALLDAALKKAQETGSDGKAELKEAANKISAPTSSGGGDGKGNAATSSPPGGGANKAGNRTSKKVLNNGIDDPDKLLAQLDELEAAMKTAEAGLSGVGTGARRRSVFDAKAQSQAAGNEMKRSYVRDVDSGAAKSSSSKAATGHDDKFMSALQRLDLDPKAKEKRRTSILEVSRPSAPKVTYLDAASTKFPYADLKNKTPAGANPAARETYLEDEEFKKIFGKTPAEFYAMPAWKIQREKKKVGLW